MGLTKLIFVFYNRLLCIISASCCKNVNGGVRQNYSFSGVLCIPFPCYFVGALSFYTLVPTASLMSLSIPSMSDVNSPAPSGYSSGLSQAESAA